MKKREGGKTGEWGGGAISWLVGVWRGLTLTFKCRVVQLGSSHWGFFSNHHHNKSGLQGLDQRDGTAESNHTIGILVLGGVSGSGISF